MRARSTSSTLATVLATASLSIAACDPKPESPAGSLAPTQTTTSPSDPPPAPATPEDEPVPSSKVPEIQGVSFTLKLGDKTATLELSKAIHAARGEGPLATWDCTAVVGSVGIVDFAIGDDPARKGDLFVVRVERSGFSRFVPGKAEKARIQIRHAGESTVTGIDATATWNADLLSGVASGQTSDGLEVEARWTCTPLAAP